MPNVLGRPPPPPCDWRSWYGKSHTGSPSVFSTSWSSVIATGYTCSYCCVPGRKLNQPESYTDCSTRDIMFQIFQVNLLLKYLFHIFKHCFFFFLVSRWERDADAALVSRGLLGTAHARRETLHSIRLVCQCIPRATSRGRAVSLRPAERPTPGGIQPVLRGEGLLLPGRIHRGRRVHPPNPRQDRTRTHPQPGTSSGCGRRGRGWGRRKRVGVQPRQTPNLRQHAHVGHAKHNPSPQDIQRCQSPARVLHEDIRLRNVPICGKDAKKGPGTRLLGGRSLRPELYPDKLRERLGTQLLETVHHLVSLLDRGPTQRQQVIQVVPGNQVW